MPDTVVLCHDCDLPSRVGAVPPGGSARCPRCRGLLRKSVPNSLDRTLAFALAGLVLFVVANAFPFLALEMQGNLTQTTLATGVRSLFSDGRPFVASLVLLTTIVAPLLQLLTLLYVLAPFKIGARLPGDVVVFRALHRVETWSMMEVFMIGILVSLVKLAGMAQIVPGISLAAFVALIPMVAAATSSLDHQLVWSRIGMAR